MPKMKSKRCLRHRFKKTASGKFIRRGSCLRHILTTKSRKQKRRISEKRVVSSADLPKLKKLLPY